MDDWIKGLLIAFMLFAFLFIVFWIYRSQETPAEVKKKEYDYHEGHHAVVESGHGMPDPALNRAKAVYDHKGTVTDSPSQIPFNDELYLNRDDIQKEQDSGLEGFF